MSVSPFCKFLLLYHISSQSSPALHCFASIDFQHQMKRENLSLSHCLPARNLQSHTIGENFFHGSMIEFEAPAKNQASCQLPRRWQWKCSGLADTQREPQWTNVFGPMCLILDAFPVKLLSEWYECRHSC